MAAALTARRGGAKGIAAAELRIGAWLPVHPSCVRVGGDPETRFAPKQLPDA
jgi:hypothetical protein